MVLEEAASSSPDSFADSPYPSDNDPYASQSQSSFDPSSSSRPNIKISLSDYPKPIPIVGPLVGYSRTRGAANVAKYLEAASVVLRRPLTQEEAQAITQHTTTSYSQTSYGAAFGAGVAMYRCYSTRESFRFPFYNLSKLETFTPDSLGPLKGNMARVGWHALRAPPYWFLGALLGAVITQSYALAKATIAIATDERLKALNEAINKRVEQRRGAGAPNRQVARGPVGAKSGAQDVDDMSPTSGAFYEPSPDTSELSNARELSREPPQQTYQRPSQTESRSNASTNRATNQSSTYDDASPTGGLGVLDSGVAGESAWERIRRQSASGQPSATGRTSGGFNRSVQREQREGSSLGDSFTFSSTDEERQLAKSQAQKEFDAQVDKERNGGDFEDSGKRW